MRALIRAAGALTGLLVLTSALPAATAAADPLQPTGPDVSRWQHTTNAPLDWTRVRAAGHTFAMVKATDGTSYTNPWFAADRAAARAAGLAVGGYAYVHPALPISTATAQAQHFVAVLGSQAAAGILPPALDLEDTGGLGPGDLVTWSQQFLETVRRLTGRTPMIYTYPYFWSSRMAASPALARYPLWFAAYRATPPSPPAGWSSWGLWQFTSAGSVPGIPGGVDVSRFGGSAGQLAAFANGALTTAWPVGRPLPPAPVTARPGIRSATVSWIPSDDGGSLPVSYAVTTSPGGARVQVPGTSTSVTLPGLTAGTAYTFSVTATNAAGSSSPSAPSRPVVAGELPGAPGAPAAGTAPGTVTLSWGASAGAPTSYLVRRCSPAPCTPRVGVGSSSATRWTDPTAVNGTAYDYDVVARNAFGSSAGSPRVTARPVGPPSAPSAVAMTGTPTSLTLTWSAPLSDGGSPLTGYSVALDGAVPVLLPPGARSWQAGGLPPGSGHRLAVAAISALGTGPAAVRSAVLSVPPVAGAPLPAFPPTAALSAPSVPVGRSVTLSGSTSRLVTGERVYRQGWYSGGWHTWASAVVAPTGRYAFVVTPTVRTLNHYRVWVPASPRHPAAASRTVDLLAR